MVNSGRNADRSASALLDAAFEQRDGYRSASAAPRVGVFGNGFPEVLVGATGAVPVHVNFGMSKAEFPSADSIAEVIEPFVDGEVRLFLLRLMDGDFADYRGIVFARDDVPALIAYQYATEWIRQGRAHAKVPPLFLWNLVHTASAPVRCFNQVQAGKLFDFLASIGLPRPDEASIAAASASEQSRRTHLVALERAETVPGSVALRWRNAGRFMAATDHARLLAEALAQPPVAADEAPAARLAIVGSPLASVATLAVFERFGRVVADLQSWGQVWPGRDAGPSVETILTVAAADPFCPRITPANAHRQALVAAVIAAGCDMVICQLAQTDDTFGWEIPALQADLTAEGIGFLNLGFRDAEPDHNWLDHAAGLIAAALEARP